MKVICVAIKNAATGASASSSSWLRLDGEYAVVGLLAVQGRVSGVAGHRRRRTAADMVAVRDVHDE